MTSTAPAQQTSQSVLNIPGFDADAYRVTGGRQVRGTITCLGAKNFVTKAMVAAVLADEPSFLSNVPPIGDVAITCDMMAAIGVTFRSTSTTELVVDPSSISLPEVPLPPSGSNRIPVLLLGALLHRFDKVKVPVVGGCDIGARGVDFHLEAMRRFGAQVEANAEGFTASRTRRLSGAQIDLPYPSVGATESCLYLAVLAEGRTVIRNAAIEPEIYELIAMLRSMGAIIFTQPNREIVIEGVSRLRGTRMEILGDRIEAASWACLAIATDGDITVNGVRPDSLGNFLSYCEKIGGGVQLQARDSIRFFRRRELMPTVLETDVFPGFSTDWQQPFAIVLTQAEGVSVIHETVYERRLGYLGALNSLGAITQVYDTCLGTGDCRFRSSAFPHSAIIRGRTDLVSSGSLHVPDLRAGLAYVIAAIVASGTTVVSGVEHIYRGYGDVAPRLANLGVDIEPIRTIDLT